MDQEIDQLASQVLKIAIALKLRSLIITRTLAQVESILEFGSESPEGSYLAVRDALALIRTLQLDKS